MSLQTSLKATLTIDDFQCFLDSIYSDLYQETTGHLATSIPELEFTDPDQLGISIVDVFGQTASIGHSNVEFTLQSAIKPFIYGATIENLSDKDRKTLIAKIGFEPTGTPFNTIIQQEDIQKGVLNPMLNAGALITSSSFQGGSHEERWKYLSDMIAGFAGRPLNVNASMLGFKKKNDHRNLALAHFIYSEGLLEGNLEDAIELYCRQCSLEATCFDVAVMAATLANSGINPVTNAQVVKPTIARNVLSVMYTCGLYDFSGQWAYRVGLPAKSGLSGIVLLVVPSICGLAVYSPRLGDKLISLRGLKVCEAFSRQFGFHIFNSQQPPFNESDKWFQSPHSGYPTRNEWEKRETSEIVASNTSQIDGSIRKRQTFDFNKLSEVIARHYSICKNIHDGVVYHSEHELQAINPNWFGVCAISNRGEAFMIGDHQQPFLIQSISKLFTYGLALEDFGRKYVLTKVDVEPTGKSYDSIIRVQQKSKRPHNPMVNTGAIAITSLIQGGTPAKRLTRILEMYKRYGGREFFIDMPTYISEQNGGYRNLAISYLLRNFEMIEGEILQTLDLYLQQCSVLLNCYDLALMGATLANGGINPVTKVEAIKSKYVKDILSIMFTCGMYDFAGEWAYKIGFPAKSGVSGAIVLVIPGVCGIAIYSPLLDHRGNSVRGLKLSEAIFKELNYHIFNLH